ncbi:hypothetical protein [Streptomyces sp. NRRL WC-3626]|uniref:hypothetical protein n=1 Tax=Streptomyces sp. NRRL WC-3626 TaxID=1463926 RepID=UPI00099814EC|nr:hypothetical protein [Streptomyces sp. NRRL WC-3626]
MSRGRRLAVMAALTCVGAVAVIAVGAMAEPEPRPTPPRVYSSCLAADTQPMPTGDDPCEGR